MTPSRGVVLRVIGLPAACSSLLVLALSACGPEPGSEAGAPVGVSASEPATPPGARAERALARLPEGEAGDVVRRGIEAAGGWPEWASKRTVSYRKIYTRYAPDGSVELRQDALHRYRLHPTLGVRIDYTDDDGREISLRNDGDEAWKLVDGELATSQEDRDHAWNSTFGSHYVFAMPFKLTDPGANLESAGRRELPDGTLADGVRVSYDEGAGSAGGMHTWTYWFSAEGERPGTLVANHLTFGPEPGDHDFTEYLDHRPMDGLYLVTRRLGYHSNAAQERLAPISQYLYEDVAFDVELADELFRPES